MSIVASGLQPPVAQIGVGADRPRVAMWAGAKGRMLPGAGIGAGAGVALGLLKYLLSR